MSGLQKLLLRKIVITAGLICLPLLTFPASWYPALGVPAPEPLMFARLLGAAYLALLVGYYLGLRGVGAGENPAAAVLMGITSNGFACALLVYFGARGSWSEWGVGAQVYLWLLAAGAFSITLNLLRYRWRRSRSSASGAGQMYG